MKKPTIFTLALAAGFFAFSPTGVEAGGRATFITIGTGGPTGVYFAAGNSICRLIHKEASKGRKHGIRCAAPATGGSNRNIGQIRDGKLDFAIAQSDWQYYAYNGAAGPWKGKPFKKLRAVFSIYPEPLQIIVGGNSGINGWDDLKGKRVNIGNPGSGQRGTMEFLMEKAGWTRKDFKLASELTSTEQSKALCDDKIDAYIYIAGIPSAGVLTATGGCGARVVNLDNALARSLVTKDRPYYTWTTIPEGADKSGDATTFGVMATFVTSADTPDRVVYEVTRAVMENIDDFRKLHPAFANLDPREMIKNGLSAPLHPGAVKYYKERGWM